MRNIEIRDAASKSGVWLWQIADALGITDANFSRKLRHELSETEKNKIFAIINQIKAEREDENQ